MKAITLHQPWASFIAAGEKTIESRTHGRFASLVGQRIAIHAGARFSRNWDRVEQGACSFDKLQRLRAVARKIQFNIRTSRIVATARIASCSFHDLDELTTGLASAACCPLGNLYAYHLAEIQPVPPDWPGAVCPGHQGIWEWDGRDPFDDVKQLNLT